MNLPLRQSKESMTEPRRADSGMQPIYQYLGLLQTSLDRYQYLKKSGTPADILYMEKGLIDRQILFLSKACAQLIRQPQG